MVATAHTCPLPKKVRKGDCRAFTKAEQDAVRVVLHQFFTEQPDGWHNSRADRELLKVAEYRAKLADGARKTKRQAMGAAIAQRIA